jgi:hypothetical protein
MVRGTVTNCAPLLDGDTLVNIIVTDNVGFITTVPPASLAPGESFDYEGFYIGEENTLNVRSRPSGAASQVVESVMMLEETFRLVRSEKPPSEARWALPVAVSGALTLKMI